ncbi:MAG: (deoxy)nucleoside triphosphate pyrophosphohydrolase [Peptococcaceae bacterium]|nr:(deoxy)nucleoside triphosphate pyrophosphohydrolase [Peptococcaceae bacterium]
MKKVTAAIVIKDGQVLIAKRKAGKRLASFWEFPGGKLEDGETPEECLKREMKEELGIEVNVGQYFGESIYHYEYGTVQLLGFWASWESGDIRPRVHDEVRWVPPDHLDEYIFAPADLPFVKKLKSLYDPRKDTINLC